jgi:hypothetical protein
MIMDVKDLWRQKAVGSFMPWRMSVAPVANQRNRLIRHDCRFGCRTKQGL